MLGGWLDPTKLSITFSTPNSFTGSASNVDLNGSCSGLDAGPGGRHHRVLSLSVHRVPLRRRCHLHGQGHAADRAQTAFRIEP